MAVKLMYNIELGVISTNSMTPNQMIKIDQLLSSISAWQGFNLMAHLVTTKKMPLQRKCCSRDFSHFISLDAMGFI